MGLLEGDLGHHGESRGCVDATGAEKPATARNPSPTVSSGSYEASRPARGGAAAQRAQRGGRKYQNYNPTARGFGASRAPVRILYYWNYW